MSIYMQGFLALLPIIVTGVFLVGLNWPASRAMPLSYITVVLVALFVWQLDVMQIVGASINGVVTTISLLYIIFGSILVLYTIMGSGGLYQIRQSLLGVTKDRRIQAIIVAWCFGSFIEGASGFGTPAAVACPLLLGLGFPAYAAVLAGMIIQSTPVSFGAVGTPIAIGVGTGLTRGADQIVNDFAAKIGYDFGSVAAGTYNPAIYDNFLWLIAKKVSILHFIGGIFIPLIICAFMTRYFGRNKSFSEGLAVWPFAIFAALANIVPMRLINEFLSYELTSMVGALVGLGIVLCAAKTGFLMPKKEWDFIEEKDWDPAWKGTIEVNYVQKPGGMSTLMAWTPYVLVAGLILVTRLIPELKAWLNTLVLKFPAIGGIGSSWGVGYSPGTIFIIVSVITFILHGMKSEEFTKAVKIAGKTSLSAGTALIFTVPMVQVFISSDGGAAGFLKMPYALAEATYALAGGMWPIFAPIIGGLGAFIAGSNTISNMTFALFQFKTGLLVFEGNPLLTNFQDWPVWVVALQALGGAAGNIICIHNVVAAAAVVGFLGREGEVVRKTFMVFCYYAIIPGAIGYSVLYANLHGFLNLGSIIALVFYASAIYVIATNNGRLKKLELDKPNKVNSAKF